MAHGITWRDVHYELHSWSFLNRTEPGLTIEDLAKIIYQNKKIQVDETALSKYIGYIKHKYKVPVHSERYSKPGISGFHMRHRIKACDLEISQEIMSNPNPKYFPSRSEKIARGLELPDNDGEDEKSELAVHPATKAFNNNGMSSPLNGNAPFIEKFSRKAYALLILKDSIVTEDVMEEFELTREQANVLMTNIKRNNKDVEIQSMEL